MSLAALCLIGGAPAGPLAASRSETARYYLVTDVAVQPANLSAYQEALKPFVAALQQHQFSFPIEFRVTDDSHVWWISPLGSLLEIDLWQRELDRVRRGMGREWQTVFAPLQSYGVENSSELYQFRRDLSFLPENPRLSLDQEPYRHHWHCYVARGRVSEYAQSMRAWAELYRESDSSDTLIVLEKVLGARRPHFVVVRSGTSEAATHGWLEALKQQAPETFDRLSRRTEACLRATWNTSSRATGFWYEP